MINTSLKVAAGTTQTVATIPRGTSIGVVPGASGSMNVQYRITRGGQLRDWDLGTVIVASDMVTDGPLFEVVFSATTSDGVAEVHRP